jgi:hypothetical protein
VSLIHLVKIKRNNDTGEETLLPLTISANDISCLYRDRKGVFLLTQRGTLHKINHKIYEVEPFIDNDIIPRERCLIQ